MRRPLASLLAALWLAGCDGCGGAAKVGEFSEVRGVVELDDAPEPVTWAFASQGAVVHVGDAVRTGASASATLALAGGGRLFVRERSLVRFGAGGAERGYRVGVELGEAEVEAVAEPIQFDSLFGEATVERGGRVRLAGAAGGGVRFEVVVGSATVESRGTSTRYETGQSFIVDVGGAIVEERAPAPPSAPVVEPTPPPPEPSTPEPEPPAVPEGAFAAAIEGAGVRVRRAGEGAWAGAAAGNTVLDEGTRVSVAAGSSVEIRGASGRAFVRGASEFTVGGAGGAIVTAASGPVVVTTETETRVLVPGGAIVVRGGASTLGVAPDGTTVRVTSGSARVEARDGSTQLAAGDSTVLSRQGRVEVAERAPTTVAFSLDAGETASIHDPRAPTAVRVRFGAQCPEEGVVELARGGTFARPIVSRGRGSANVLIPAGSQRYRVRCVSGDTVSDDVAAQGTLRVVRDAGTQSPSRTAPKTTVETDGRRYTVVYQSLLPEITVSWPRPPEASGYELTVTGPGARTQTVRSARPTTVFPSGRLEEGTYSFVWAGEGSSRSRPTTVVISFDDDTPVAYLRSPSPTAPLSAPIRVEGVAQEGASASVGGAALAMDGRTRFRGDVPAPPQGECLAVRVAHPERGVHYYLRCGERQ